MNHYITYNTYIYIVICILWMNFYNNRLTFVHTFLHHLSVRNDFRRIRLLIVFGMVHSETQFIPQFQLLSHYTL